MPKYSVRIEKKDSIRGYIQVSGTRLCSAIESYKSLGYQVKTIKKIKECDTNDVRRYYKRS